MRIVVAPDKFTGSLTALQAAAAIADGVRSVLPGASVVERPVADGGDGTIDALVAAGWTTTPVDVAGPTGVPGTARIAWREATAVVELAECCGRLRLPAGRAAPMTATTRGLGDAVAGAVVAGAREVVVAVGGSASTDGGLGLLAALGVHVLDEDSHPVTVPAGLARAARIDSSGALPALRGVRLVLATDVSAPLLGTSGAAQLFGPQKGASAEQVQQLETAMRRWAGVLAAHTGRDIASDQGAGAAGGVVAGALGALDGVCAVSVTAGAPFVLDAVELSAELAGAGLVVVGEGCLDAQSLLGKAPVAVARLALGYGCRVAAVVGRLDLDSRSLRDAGIEHVVELRDLAEPGSDPMRDAARLARLAGERIAARL